jgi:effector-binding domain-containing protein
MTNPFLSRIVVRALIPAAILFGSVTAQAQSPAANPAPAPSTNPPPGPGTPAPSTSPNPGAAPAGQNAPPMTAPVQAADPFGEEVTLEPKKVVIVKGSANWDAAFDMLMDSFKALNAFLEKQGIPRTGNPMIVYTSTDDNGFSYLAEIPVEQEPKNLAKDMSLGKSPDGRALKFVHRGSYDNMDNTYEAITNHLDDKKLEAKDTFIEEYMTDPLKTAEDKLIINVYVPLK